MVLDYGKNVYFYESSGAMLVNRYISYAVNLQYSQKRSSEPVVTQFIEAHTERDTQSDIIARFHFWRKKTYYANLWRYYNSFNSRFADAYLPPYMGGKHYNANTTRGSAKSRVTLRRVGSHFSFRSVF